MRLGGRRGFGGVGMGALASVLVGCGGAASFVLKAPIADQCSQAGLRGCDELTEGALLFAEGKTEEGKRKALAGARKNAPEDVRRYAEMLRAAKNLPGLADYARPLSEFADALLEGPEGATVVASVEGTVAGNGAVRATTNASDGGGSATERSERPTPLRDGVVNAPVMAMKICEHAWGVGTRCEAIARGPLVVSDLESLGVECRGQFVAVLRNHLPRFRLEGPFATHGARYLLDAGDVLLLGQTPSPPPPTTPPGAKPSKVSPAEDLALDEEDSRYACGLYYSGEGR